MLAHLGSTDESASINEDSTLPGMSKAPYLGTWVMKDKGMDSFTWSFLISGYFSIFHHMLSTNLYGPYHMKDSVNSR